MPLTYDIVREPLATFLTEDVGTGDLTDSILTPRRVVGTFTAKTAGVVAGIALPAFLCRILETDDLVYQPAVADGEMVAAGTTLATITGDVAHLLKIERTALNLMQRMSGIATATQQAVTALNDPTIQILDTRKTAPGLRLFDKYAVRCGGGVNHRMGLFDLAMLKDNHLATITDLPAAVQILRTAIGPSKRIEVEVRTLNELQAAIAANVDIIMFDNQTPETVAYWATLTPSNIQTEASGGITLSNLPQFRGSNVTAISLGYLTNTVVNMDISFNLIHSADN